MSVPAGWGDPESIPRLVADHIINTAAIANPTVTTEYLTNCIGEVTPETQTSGPALLQVTLIDPDWVIARSGICSRTAGGLLQPVDVNFPEGTPVWWRLAMIDFSSDLTQPNLTLTFQHRTIAYLMRCFGPLGWPGGVPKKTRAQFIKMLLDKMPSELPKNLIGPVTADGYGAPNDFKFVCPELGEIQPVASSGTYGTEVVTAQNAAAKAAGINKLPSITAASHVTIKGVTPTAQQTADINTAIGQAQALHANDIATQALLCAGIGESTFNRYSTDEGHNGIWQSSEIPGDQVAQQAAAFLQGGQSFQAGGAIKLSATVKDPGQIATMVEAGGEPASFYSKWLPEAKTIMSASGALLLNKGISATPTSDIASLERGSADDPDEDSWTCMQRLATEVNWNIFSDPQPHPGEWGNYIYYIDGPTLVAQKPALYLSLSDTGNYWSAQDPETGKFLDSSGDGLVTSLTATMDNSAVQVYQGVEVAASNGASGSAKVSKQTRIQRPQTPSEMTFDLILGGRGVLTYNAGKVVVVRNAGPLDGRWIISDNTHNVLGDLFAQVTLEPPIFAYPEPQANTATVIATNGQAITISTGSGTVKSLTATNETSNVSLTPISGIQQGALAGVAQAALKALADQEATHVYVYLEQVEPDRNAVTPSLFVPGNGPRIMDCSKFTTLCYQAAGLPDPNNQNYNPIGNTKSLIDNCTPIAQSSAQPGDMCFFGADSAKPVHVNVYVGNGHCVNMGSPGEPRLLPVGVASAPFIGFYRSKFVSTITAAPVTTPTATGIGVVKTATTTSTTGSPGAGVFGKPFDNLGP